MNEEQVVWSLISSQIEKFKAAIYDQVKSFYKSFDPRKSLDRSFIVYLISRINDDLNFVFSEVEDGKKDYC